MFQEVEPEALRENPFKPMGSDWMLITAGTPASLKIPVENSSGSTILQEECYSNCSLIPGFNSMTATREGAFSESSGWPRDLSGRCGKTMGSQNGLTHRRDDRGGAAYCTKSSVLDAVLYRLIFAAC